MAVLVDPCPILDVTLKYLIVYGISSGMKGSIASHITSVLEPFDFEISNSVNIIVNLQFIWENLKNQREDLLISSLQFLTVTQDEGFCFQCFIYSSRLH